MSDADAFDRMPAAQFTKPPQKRGKRKKLTRRQQRIRKELRASTSPTEWHRQYIAHLHSQKWRLFKLNILAKRGAMCERCGRFGKRLELHHISYERMGHELPEDVKLYCVDCHTAMHKDRPWAGRGGELPSHLGD